MRQQYARISQRIDLDEAPVYRPEVLNLPYFPGPSERPPLDRPPGPASQPRFPGRRCPTCGTPADAGDRFCAQCGALLAAEDAAGPGPRLTRVAVSERPWTGQTKPEKVMPVKGRCPRCGALATNAHFCENCWVLFGHP